MRGGSSPPFPTRSYNRQNSRYPLLLQPSIIARHGADLPPDLIVPGSRNKAIERARAYQPWKVMCPKVAIHLVATFLPQYRQWLFAFRAKHPGPEKRQYPFALLAPAAASLPEIVVSSQPLFLGGENTYPQYPIL